MVLCKKSALIEYCTVSESFVIALFVDNFCHTRRINRGLPVGNRILCMRSQLFDVHIEITHNPSSIKRQNLNAKFFS